MGEDKSLKQLYRQQYDLYPTLSQEEIVALYESEGIREESVDEVIEQLHELIKHKKDELSALRLYKLMSSIFGDDSEKMTVEVESLEQEISQLERQANKLQRNYKDCGHKFFVSTRGIIPKNRVYPSIELRNKVVCGTLWLAKYWAGKYYRKTDNDVSFDDLLQMAYMALMSAAHYYIPSDRAKFSTYASKCIENKLKREIYHRKKVKKRSCKPEEFFQKEKDKIKYIKMFLEAHKSKKGLNKYYTKVKPEYISSILRRFRQNVRIHNREMKLTGQTSRLLPSFSGDRTSKKYDDIVERIISMINDSKMKALVTNDDRELANLTVNYQKIPPEQQEIYELIYYLDCYLYKLDLIELYLETEKELTSKNEGVPPTDDEILEELGKKVRREEREIYKLKTEGLWETRYRITSFNYYHLYKKLYEVDPFVSPDEYQKYKSKKQEREDIADYAQYEILERLDCLIESIENCLSDRVILYFSEDELIYDDWEEFWGEEDYDDEVANVFSKAEALERLRTIKRTIPELVDDYVEAELRKRRDIVNAELAKENAPMVQHNQLVRTSLEKSAFVKRTKQLLRSTESTRISDDIELLFADDSELLILLNSNANQRGFSRQATLSVEEEAENDAFLEDYYEALSNLPEEEREVLLRYFNEDGIHSMKAEDIASELGISKSRVYKIKAKALKRLSKNPKLQSYNEEE